MKIASRMLFFFRNTNLSPNLVYLEMFSNVHRICLVHLEVLLPYLFYGL